MSASDFLQLPPAVTVLFVVMLWPALWAGALLTMAFAGDVTRQARARTSPARRKVA